MKSLRLTACRAIGMVCLSWAFTWASARASSAEPIDTDGPDFVESSESVPQGRFQYEIDFMAVHDRRSGRNGSAFSTPSLLKYGISKNLELRAAPEGYVHQDGHSGLGDTAFGLKWHSQDRDASAGRPAVSWILHFDTPSGAASLRGAGIRPSLRSVVTWDLPRDLSLGVMPGLKHDSDGQGRQFNPLIFGTVLNKRFSERLRGFVELSAPQIARARDGGVVADWDVGAAYLLNDDLQVGARAGIAANRNTPAAYVLLEVAQRF